MLRECTETVLILKDKNSRDCAIMPPLLDGINLLLPVTGNCDRKVLFS